MTRVGVDVGGTFTDLVAVKPDGTLDIRKVASTPQDPSVGLFRALDALGADSIDVLVHGTTVATNALLERRGARVALVTTAGFEDLLWLRRQDRRHSTIWRAIIRRRSSRVKTSSARKNGWDRMGSLSRSRKAK